MRIKSLRTLRLINLVLLLAMPALAAAQSTGLIFERTKLQIATSAATADPAGSAATTQPPVVTYDVELRPEDSLRLEYIHTLNTLNEQNGVLIGLEAPAMIPLPPMKVYVPVDVLFIAEDGTLLQIAPNVVMGELAQTIQAKSPIKGLLFIKAGEAARRGFAPHRSLVTAKIFLTPPAVQD